MPLGQSKQSSWIGTTSLNHRLRRKMGKLAAATRCRQRPVARCKQHPPSSLVSCSQGGDYTPARAPTSIVYKPIRKHAARPNSQPARHNACLWASQHPAFQQQHGFGAEKPSATKRLAPPRTARWVCPPAAGALSDRRPAKQAGGQMALPLPTAPCSCKRQHRAHWPRLCAGCHTWRTDRNEPSPREAKRTTRWAVRASTRPATRPPGGPPPPPRGQRARPLHRGP